MLIPADRLSELETRAIALARMAQEWAHAPYSNKLVGAAVITAAGSIFTGCNVENLAGELGVCAERNAIGAAIAAGHRDFSTVVVIAPDERLWPPCNLCRPVIVEFSANPSVLLISGESIWRARFTELGDRPFSADGNRPNA
ncbi:MAG TPA: cytidine deaminase [candidate division Zixibacteria bacterium]|jgi:cytidine deaminase